MEFFKYSGSFRGGIRWEDIDIWRYKYSRFLVLRWDTDQSMTTGPGRCRTLRSLPTAGGWVLPWSRCSSHSRAPASTAAAGIQSDNRKILSCKFPYLISHVWFIVIWNGIKKHFITCLSRHTTDTSYYTLNLCYKLQMSRGAKNQTSSR